jgi:hypothetical protein
MVARTRELKTFGWYFLVALVTELGVSYWTWGHSPTHALRDLYEGDFLAYEAERLIPWLIIFVPLGVARALIKRKSAAEI